MSARSSAFSSRAESPRGSTQGPSTPRGLSGLNLGHSSVESTNNARSGASTPGGMNMSMTTEVNSRVGSNMPSLTSAVINPPVQPTSFAPAEIDTNDPNRLKDIIQDQHTQLMKLHLELEVIRGQRAHSLFHDSSRKTIATAADLEYRRLLSEIEALKSSAKQREATRESELARVKENSQLQEQELRDEIEERERKMNELGRAEKERFDNAAKAYEETIFNQDVQIKKLKEDIERAKAKNVTNMEAKDLEIETLKNDYRVKLAKTREELEKQRLDELMTEKSESSKRFDDMKDKLDHLVGDLRSNVNKLSIEKETFEKSSRDQMSKLNVEVAAKTKQLKELGMKFETITKENEKLKTTVKELKAEQEKLSREKEAEFQQSLTLERSKAKDELEQAREISLKTIKEKDASIVDLKRQLQEMTSKKTLVEQDLTAKLNQTEDLLSSKLKQMTAEYENRSKQDKKVFEDLKLKTSKDAELFRDTIDKLTKERDANKISFAKEKAEISDTNQKQLEKVTAKFKSDLENLKLANQKDREDLTNQFKSEEEKLNKKKLDLEKDLRLTREQMRKALEEREQLEKLKSTEVENLKQNYKLLQEDQKNSLETFEKTSSELKAARQQELERITLEHKTETDRLNNELREFKLMADANIAELEQIVRDLTENVETCKRENAAFEKKKEQETKLLREEYERKIANDFAKFESDMKLKSEEVEKLKNSAKDMESKFTNEINELNVQRQNLLDDFEKEKKELVQNYEDEKLTITRQNEERVRSLEDELNREISEFRELCSKRDEEIHNLKINIQELSGNLEKLESTAKKDLEHVEMMKDKEIAVLQEEIASKNSQISDIEAKHASQLEEIQDKNKEEMYYLMSEYQAFKNENEAKILALDQQRNFDILGKDNEITDLRNKLENLHRDLQQQMEDYEGKLQNLRDENEKNENALKEEHEMELKMKDENIESLQKNVEFVQQEQLKEQDKFKEVLKSYKEHFTQMKKEVDDFVDELNRTHDLEKQKLNESIEALNVEKVKIMEQWKAMEKELTESHFNEVKHLRETHFETVKALDEELRATQEALKDMTLQRDQEIDENKNLVERVGILEADAKWLTEDINRRMEEMTQNILKLEAEKKAEFEEHQKEINALNDAKKEMELSKDKLFHEMKRNLEQQLKTLKADSETKIAKQSSEKQALNVQIKELTQKFTAMSEEKDAILSKTRIELTEQFEKQRTDLKKQYDQIVNEKAKKIDSLVEKSEQLRKQFEQTFKTQKAEFQKTLAERDQFVQKLKEEHSQSVKEVEEHCELYKTNAESKVKELNNTKKSSKEAIGLKDGEIERFLVEVTQVREKLTEAESMAKLAETREEEVKNIESAMLSKADEIAALNTKVITLSDNEKEHLREIDVLNGDIYGLKNKITGCEAEIRDANYKLQSSEQYAYSLRKDLDEKEKQLSDALQKYQHEKYQNQAKERKIEELKTQLNARSYMGTTGTTPTSRYDSYDSPSASKWSSLKSDVLNKSSSLYSSSTNVGSSYDSGAYDSSKSTLPRSTFTSSREPSPTGGRYGGSSGLSSSTSGIGRSNSLLSSSTPKYSSPTTGSYSSKYK